MMMMPVRPEMIQDLHLASFCLNKPAAYVNSGKAPKNRYAERVFWMLEKLTFPGCSVIFVWYLVEVRLPLVAGRAFPISFGRSRKRGKCC
jgi:hypothetical protein